MKVTRRERLRDNLRRTLEHHRALCILLRAPAKSYESHFAAEFERIDSLNNRELEEAINDAQERVDELRRKLGVQLGESDLFKFIDPNRRGSSQFLFMPRWQLQLLATRLEKEVPSLKQLPFGARLSLDVAGLGRKPELRLLEAHLFEDMALHFNTAMELEGIINAFEAKESRLGPSKKQIKLQGAALRGAATSAFYCLEAYLNSIAFDYLVEHEDTVPPETRVILTEWDADANDGKGRERYLSLRQKLLQYPRIILQAQHPPLLENNCQEMAAVLDNAKLLRDAIVHPTPNLDPRSDTPDKELAFMSIGVETVAAVVDNTIALIRRLESLIHGSTDRLFWVVDRRDGIFPESAFE